MKKAFLVILLCPVLSYGQQADVIINKEVSRVAFGSCSKQDFPEKQLWNEINETDPDLWIWLGDNIYGDTEDMSIMKEKYDFQKSHPDYQELLKNTEVIGIWDDHDYGVNDGGKEYPAKDESKEQLFAFLDVDRNHPARSRKGAYQSYTYQSREGNVKVILLDVRYFRDSLKWSNPGTSQKESIPNPNGDILGEAQWKWFESQLQDKNINLFIVASGIQVIPEEHRWEKWSNFPKSRRRLLEAISKVNTPIALISGDRHLSEISKMDIQGYIHPLYEFTSSSLTSPSGGQEEPNQYIIKEKMFEVNFASMTILWVAKNPILSVKYIGENGKALVEQRIQYQ